MIPAIRTLHQVSKRIEPIAQLAIQKCYLHAPKKEDAAKHDLLTQFKSQPEDLWDRKCKDHRVRQNVPDGIRDPEGFRVNACCDNGLVPRARNRNALQYRRSDRTNVPAHDGTHARPACVLESFADEYTLAEQDRRYFVQSDNNFVRCLSDEEPFQCGRELLLRKIGSVHTIAVRYGELYRD
jgi:hypothetical protein